MRHFWAVIVLAASVVAGPDSDGLYAIEGKAILEHIKFLASDQNNGRAAGSPGCFAAADYIAAHLRTLGLEPVGDKGTYFQNFSLPRGFEIRAETSLKATRGKKKVLLSYDKDLKPLSLSGPGDVTAGAVFAGYGIAAPALGYDDYEGLDVKGKVVLVLRHAPRYSDRASPFSRPGTRRRYAGFKAKVDTATGAGAAALVVLNDPRNTKSKDDVPLHAVGGNAGKIPVFHVSYRAGKKLARVCGFSIQREQYRIDKSFKAASRPLEGVTLRVNAALEAKQLPVRNICALVKAPRATETLVIGAHYDHLGLGEYGSLAGSRGRGVIHNGADDNASGSSSVLELAAWFTARKESLRRDVLFLWFTAEELGLLGSKHYVDAPVIPLERCVAMVNLDMVGRLKGSRLQIGGTGTSPIFPKLIEPLVRHHRIGKHKLNPGGRAPSDNTSFYNKGMPVLFFFTGLHKDYHRPSDDWNRIDRKGMEKVARVVAETCLDLATRATRPPFARSDASGLDVGPFLGLSFEERTEGVFVIFVEKKSPASRARLKVGDKIEEFDGKPIDTITGFNQVHTNTKPGQKVKITVRRGPRLITKTVTLGQN